MKKSVLARHQRIKIGQKINQLTAIGPAFQLQRISKTGKVRSVVFQVFQCDCGTIDAMLPHQVLSGDTISCGCHKRTLIGERSTTHGLTHHPLFQIWRGIKKRCHCPSNPGFKNYGARGIFVCDEWLHSFESFFAWANPRYSHGLQIDRINNNREYSPSNCRFVTCQVNQRNRRSNHLVTAWNETKTIIEWSEDSRCKVSVGTLASRLSGKMRKAKMSPETAISEPATPNGRLRRNPTHLMQDIHP